MHEARVDLPTHEGRGGGDLTINAPPTLELLTTRARRRPRAVRAQVSVSPVCALITGTGCVRVRGWEGAGAWLVVVTNFVHDVSDPEVPRWSRFRGEVYGDVATFQHEDELPRGGVAIRPLTFSDCV